jgi:hypothetical protein
MNIVNEYSNIEDNALNSTKNEIFNKDLSSSSLNHSICRSFSGLENSYALKKARKKQDDLKNLEKKFGMQMYGIHKHELPKFFDIRHKIFNNSFKTPDTAPYKVPKTKSHSVNQSIVGQSATNAFETIFSNDLDIVELKELKRNTNLMHEKFYIKHKPQYSAYFANKIKAHKEKKELALKAICKKAMLIQNRINNSFKPETKNSKNKFRSSGFI